MKGRSRRMAVAAVLLVVATGGFVGAMAVSPEEPAPVPVEVPVGRIDDRVEYAGTRDGQPYRLALAVAGVGPTPDRFGVIRDSVRLMQREEPPPMRDVRMSPCFGTSTCPAEQAEEQRQDYIDLASRMPVRGDSFGSNSIEAGLVSDLGLASDFRFVTAQFGPGTPAGLLDSRTILVEHQGTTLSLGQPVASRCRPPPGPKFEVLSERSWIASQGLVAGEPAVEARTERTFRYVGADGTVTSTESLRAILVAGIPYPVQWSRTVTDNGPMGQRVRTDSADLVSFVAGNDPIPWTDRCAEAGAPLERTTAAHPEDGTGFRLPYPQADAIASLESDPTLPAFIAWRMTHPDHRIVGFTYLWLPGAEEAATEGGWVFWYASGPDIIAVRSYKQSADDPPVNSVVIVDTFSGEGDPAPIAPDELPQDPITIAQLEFLWRLGARTEFEGEGLNFLEWGLTGPYNPSGRIRYSRNMDLFAAGHDAGVNVNGGEGGFYDRLWFNLTTNEVVYYWGLTFEGFLPGAAPGAPPPRDVAFGGTMPASPGYAALLVGSVSLLAVALSVLLSPTVKQWALGLWAGYAKIAPEALLNHPRRRALLDAIEAEPGVSPPELAERLGMAWSTLVYHLSVLERRQVVSSLKDGHHKRLFATRAGTASRRATAVVRNPTTKAVLERVQASPGIHAAQIARSLGISPQALTRHVRRLQDAGLVETHVQGRSVGLHPKSELSAVRIPPA